MVSLTCEPFPHPAKALTIQKCIFYHSIKPIDQINNMPTFGSLQTHSKIDELKKGSSSKK